jgi:26S proteasome regulatory subunit N10
MVLEATVICLDNSDWMRNGDYIPTRLEAQQDAVNLICGAKTQSNPESTVSILSCAGKSPEVLVTLTSDLGKVLSSVQNVRVGGNFDFQASMQVAQLVLKHRQNKNQHQRVIIFVGSPIESDSASLVRLAKRLKKNNIAVDIVNFGEEAQNTEKLEAFTAAVNSKDNSHLVTIPPGPHILSDILISSPIISGEEGSGVSGAGADFGAYGGVDPNLEPELALALKMSLEEERARQDEANKKAEGAQQAPSSTSQDQEMTDVQDDDEDLQAALAMSMQGESKPTQAEPPKPQVQPQQQTDVEMDDDDEDMRLAMQMSLAQSSAPQTTQQTTSAPKPEANQDLMEDPNFVNSILRSLPGVDPEDERIKNALKQLEQKKDQK